MGIPNHIARAKGHSHHAGGLNSIKHMLVQNTAGIARPIKVKIKRELGMRMKVKPTPSKLQNTKSVKMITANNEMVCRNAHNGQAKNAA